MNKDLNEFAASRLSPIDVVLAETSCRNYEGIYEVGDPFEVRVQYRWPTTLSASMYKAPDGDRHVRYIVETGIRIIKSEGENVDQEQEDQVIAFIEAKFMAEFVVDESKLNDGDEPKFAEALKEFGDRNAVFQVWPYWREYIGSMCSRFRIPLLPIPMYTVGMRKKSEEQQRD